MKSSYFEDSDGNKSSTRLLGFIVVIWSLVLASCVLYFGKDNVILAAAASGTIFTTIAGPTLLWMFQQKNKNENGSVNT